jgi:hypothetical protein
MQSILAVFSRLALIARRGSDLDPNDAVHPERGATTLEWAGLGAISIAVIVVLGAAMQALGLNVIDWIQTQLIGS